MTTPNTDASERFARANRMRQLWDSAGMLVMLLLLLGVCAICVPHFRTAMNMRGLAQSVTLVGIVACTMLFCMAAGDFDLSVGSVAAMGGVVAALVVNHTNSAMLGIVCGTLAGAVIGLFNGFIIAQIGINALITTLGTMQIARGLALIISHNNDIGVSNENFTRLGSVVAGLDMPVWIMIGCFIFFGLLLHRTVFGRNTLAIGGNREAAKLAGIAVTRIKIIIFTMQGAMAAFAGVILAGQLFSALPNAGLGLELLVISACVLGGVSLTGGIGTILAVIVGTLIMGTIQDAMSLLNIDSAYQYVISGGVLILAVLIDRFKQRQTR